MELKKKYVQDLDMLRMVGSKRAMAAKTENWKIKPAKRTLLMKASSSSM
jgi:hypothetical protein